MVGARCPDNVGDEIERYDDLLGALNVDGKWIVQESDSNLGVRMTVIEPVKRTIIYEGRYSPNGVVQEARGLEVAA